ncbi:hypothetical protein A0H81_01542 [Grifola frondosa]|uniref:MYND-type domain-containing protein n=1 Tax=Grifola frondosa TaxID=5627 RepID=A0A1C7MQP7_GRIFR|nr:hypothetical protein A0H81_01542 [Grifola frondosa]
MDRKIPLVSFRNIEAEARFNATTPSEQEIKNNLKVLTAICSYCGQERKPEKVKYCSRCKTERYCSVECQKAHWREHKATCGPPTDTEKHRDIAMKLAERAIVNAALMDHLDMYAILLLELLEDVSNAKRFVMHITCGTGPADMMAAMRRLMDGVQEDPAAPEQVLLTIEKIERIPVEEASPFLVRALMQVTEKTEKMGSTDPVVLMYFTSETGGLATVLSARPILGLMLEYMATKPTMEVHSSMFGVSHVPLNERTLKEALNNTVRMDKENKFKLRAYPHPKLPAVQ